MDVFKTSYCNFLEQLKLHDNEDNIIEKYIKEHTSDDKIEDTLNKMVNNLENYSEKIKNNDYSIFAEDSEIEFLSEIDIKTIWKKCSDNEKKTVFSHINYCNVIGKFVLNKATLEDIQSLHSRNQEEEQEEEQQEQPEVMTEEEQKKMMNDLNGITDDLENLEKNIRETIGDESINEMQEQLQGIFGNMFNPENTDENTENPLSGLFENMQNGGNPFENMFDTGKLQQMSEDIKSKVDSGEIDEEKLKQTSEDMMKMVGKLSQNLGPLLGNMMSGLSQAENGDNEDAGLGDIGSLLGGLMGGMGGMGGNSDQKTDPLSRAMSAGMQAMADKNGGDSNPLAGLMSAFTGGSLTNDEKSELRAEERQSRNRRELRKKYREQRRKRQKQIKKQKKQMSKKTPTAKK